MRIIAGKYGSRAIQAVPSNSTRPTTDKVKEAIFSRIGPYFEQGRMLDLFAGSGAMSLEAISRGIEKSVLVEKDYKAISTIQKNIQALDCKENCTVLKQDVFVALKRLQEEQFDLIFMDPPYLGQRIEEILRWIDEHDMLASDGNLVAECNTEDVLPLKCGRLYQVKTAEYGITRITYYRKEELEND